MNTQNMINVLDKTMYQNPVIRGLNICSIIIDAIIILWFLLHFFPLKNSKYREWKWVLLFGTLWGILVNVIDILNLNYYWTYYFSMLIPSIILVMVLCKGRIYLKCIMPLYILTLMTLTEEIIMLLTKFAADDAGFITFRTAVIWFLVRRYVTKIFLSLVSVFFVRRSVIRTDEAASPVYWTVLTVIVTLGFFTTRARSTGYLFGIIRYEIFVSMCFVIILVMVFFLVSELIRMQEESRTSLALLQQIQLQNKYNAQVTQMSESVRRFHHDFKQHLFCMDALLEQKQYDELHEYLVSIHQMSVEGMNLVEYCSSPALNVLLNQKMEMAGKMGIQFDADVCLPPDGKVSQQDLNALVFNLLDNALEAAALTENAFIRLSIAPVKAYLQVEVTNSVAQNVMKSNPKFSTGKADAANHGFGLKIVNSIVKKYDGLYDVHGDEHAFTSRVLLLD